MALNFLNVEGESSLMTNAELAKLDDVITNILEILEAADEYDMSFVTFFKGITIAQGKENALENVIKAIVLRLIEKKKYDVASKILLVLGENLELIGKTINIEAFVRRLEKYGVDMYASEDPRSIKLEDAELPNLVYRALAADGRFRTLGQVIKAYKSSPDYLKRSVKNLGDAGAVSLKGYLEERGYLIPTEV